MNRVLNEGGEAVPAGIKSSQGTGISSRRDGLSSIRAAVLMVRLEVRMDAKALRVAGLFVAIGLVCGCVSGPSNAIDTSTAPRPGKDGLKTWPILADDEIGIEAKDPSTGSAGSPEKMMILAAAQAERQGWKNGIRGVLILGVSTVRERRVVVAPLTMEALKAAPVNWEEVDYMIVSGM